MPDVTEGRRGVWVMGMQHHSTEDEVKPVSKPRLLSVEQVAERLGVAPRYVRRLAAERRIRFFKVGHLLRFAEDDLDEWIEQICTEPIRALSTLNTVVAARPSATTRSHRAS